MPKKEWTDDEVREEIREAVRIVNEDREKATYQQLHERYGAKPEGEEGKEEGGPNPPPKKEKTEETPKKSRSIWWPSGDDESE